mmetsp:Transcript_13336/g.38671  ORF Transcript_13336/g.38671 Transcript_13336/m.38671 type:complete len:237 (-) Transcript_13336:872-1582(-)
MTGTKVTIQQVAALVRVRVASKHKVDAILLKHRNQVLSQLVALVLCVGVVAALAVRRLVVIGNNPRVVSPLRLRQVLLKPLVKRRVVMQAEMVGVHRHKVNWPIVEGVVGLVMRRDPSRLSVAWIREQLKVWSSLSLHVGGEGIVVSWRREDRHASILLSKVVKEALLIFPILSAQISQVSQAQSQIPVSSSEVGKGIPDSSCLVIAPPAVTNCPNSDGILKLGFWLRKGGEGVVP